MKRELTSKIVSNGRLSERGELVGCLTSKPSFEMTHAPLNLDKLEKKLSSINVYFDMRF